MRSRSFAIVLLVATLPGPAACGGSTSRPETAAAAVRIEITAPADTPDGAVVLVRGDAPPFTGEDGEGLRLTREGPGLWTGSAPMDAGATRAFTLRLRNPEAEELTPWYEPVAARTFAPAGDPDTLRAEVQRWGYAVAAGESPITFLISVPASTPEGAAIGISGNHPALGTWDGHGVTAVRRPDGRYAARAIFPDGAALEFKVTRGSWDTVEKGPAGEEIANRRHTVTGAATVEITVATWRDLTEGERPHTVSGDVRFHRGMTSAFLDLPRDVAVYLPPGYDDGPARRYPVLYMHDGQNLFDAATSFLGIEWGVDETAESLIAAGAIEPLIIVGVYNTSARVAEYTPVANDQGQGGRAADYGRFLVEELKPFIDATYRTDPEADATGVAGSSLGGLVSLYFGLEYPGVFHRLGVVSPSVWWADRDILARVAAAGRTPARVWVDMGTAEGGSTLVDARALRDALVAAGWTPGVDLAYVEDPGAQHNEAAWAGRIDDILRFLYPPAASAPGRSR